MSPLRQAQRVKLSILFVIFLITAQAKLGFAIAEAFAKRGANVTLIAGPVNLATPKNVHRIDVTTAHEMWQASLESAVKNSYFIGCAQ